MSTWVFNISSDIILHLVASPLIERNAHAFPLSCGSVGSAVYSGIGSASGPFTVKALQVKLAVVVVPHDSTDSHHKVAVYDAIFHEKKSMGGKSSLCREKGFALTATQAARAGCIAHEKRNNPPCHRDRSGLTTGIEYARVTLTRPG